MSVMDKNLDIITYAVSLIVKAVIMALPARKNSSRPSGPQGGL